MSLSWRDGGTKLSRQVPDATLPWALGHGPIVPWAFGPAGPQAHGPWAYWPSGSRTWPIDNTRASIQAFVTKHQGRINRGLGIR